MTAPEGAAVSWLLGRPASENGTLRHGDGTHGRSDRCQRSFVLPILEVVHVAYPPRTRLPSAGGIKWDSRVGIARGGERRPSPVHRCRTSRRAEWAAARR